MPASVDLVISSKPGTTAMPTWATEFTFLVRMLEQLRVMEAAQRLGPVRRSDAADMPAIILFLLAFFCCGGKGGQRGFDDHMERWRQRLAAMGGRKSLPSSSAVSRALAALTMEQAQALESMLLLASVSGSVLPGHVLAAWRDALGHPWCVVDLDPTVQALRQRALPEGEDLPPPRRRAAPFAAPGYPGRKRGEVIVSMCRTQFSGSGLWCSVSAVAGNTPMAPAVAAALRDVTAMCKQAGVPLDRTIMRIDGAGGTVPCVAAVEAVGVRFVTRSARYRLLDIPEVRQWLADAPWQPVPDSLSGPHREAVELGEMTWVCDRHTRQPDGQPYDPVSPRMVVSRFKPSDPEHKHGSGVLAGGWHFELFGCDLDPNAWPAEQTVALYYGRSELENRFGQENSEMALNRVFSHNLPGQVLATAVGMCVWNRRIGCGAQLSGITAESAFPPEPLVPLSQSLPAHVPAALSAPQDPAIPEKTAPPDVADLDWDAALADRPGWTRTEDDLVKCPAGKTLRLHSRLNAGNSGVGLIFRGTKGACRQCPLRPNCTESDNPTFRKEIRVMLRSRAKPNPPRAPGPPPPAWRPPPSGTSATQPLQPPRLVPSELRHLWIDALADLEVRVHVTLPPAAPPLPRWIAPNPARRQHRRRSWQERRAIHGLPDTATVILEFRRTGHRMPPTPQKMGGNRRFL